MGPKVSVSVRVPVSLVSELPWNAVETLQPSGQWRHHRTQGGTSNISTRAITSWA